MIARAMFAIVSFAARKGIAEAAQPKSTDSSEPAATSSHEE